MKIMKLLSPAFDTVERRARVRVVTAAKFAKRYECVCAREYE